MLLNGDPELICSQNFPYKTQLSFEIIADEWRRIAERSQGITKDFAESVLSRFESAKELHGVVADLSVLNDNMPLIRELLSFQYPANDYDRIIRASSLPFNFIFFLQTPRFQHEINLGEETNLTTLGMDPEIFNIYKTLNAALIILKVIYKRPIIVPNPVIISVPDSDTGLTRYFRIMIDARYVKVEVNGEVPPLDEVKLLRVLENFGSISNITDLFSPSVFEFHGFITFDFFEVTDEQVLSDLRFRFLQNSALLDDSNFKVLVSSVRNLLRDPEIKVGLVAFPEESDISLKGGKNVGGHSFVLNSVCSSVCNDFNGSVYQEAVKQNKSITITDVENRMTDSVIEKQISTLGIKSLSVIPVTENGRLYGVLEIGSQEKGKINSVTVRKIESLIPILSVALKRTRDEREKMISALIEQKCTSIHPSVKWRFRQAASRLLDNSNNIISDEMEDIVFNDLYPLYGLTDIRNSSVFRNQAITGDLSYQTESLYKILNLINQRYGIPLIDHYLERISEASKRLSAELHSGDEDEVNELIKTELEPALKIFGDKDKEIKKLKDDYFAWADTRLSPFFIKRNQYENSVVMLNNLISAVLDEENARAQQIFPHYFEKYKTDGVEHSIYIGQSLINSHDFDLLFLKNLRLWQVQTICRIIAECNEIKSNLPLELETTSLILAQSNPVSIRFRKDEKKFDADGTYNLRYEIMKKRIDKVRLRDSDERLTQPGMISVVFSQNREYDEYRRYFDYLVKKKVLNHKPAVLELENLQGVSGLRALRSEVNTGAIKFSESLESKERISFLEKEILSI